MPDYRRILTKLFCFNLDEISWFLSKLAFFEQILSSIFWSNLFQFYTISAIFQLNVTNFSRTYKQNTTEKFTKPQKTFRILIQYLFIFNFWSLSKPDFLFNNFFSSKKAKQQENDDCIIFFCHNNYFLCHKQVALSWSEEMKQSFFPASRGLCGTEKNAEKSWRWNIEKKKFLLNVELKLNNEMHYWIKNRKVGWIDWGFLCELMWIWWWIGNFYELKYKRKNHKVFRKFQ